MHRSPISIETKDGPRQQASGTTLVVQAQVVRVRLPFGELVWNRPLAVRVEAPGASPRTLPVIDVTRLAVWAMLGLGLASLALLQMRAAAETKRHEGDQT